ncbi:MAG: restriction endonuclease subunit S [Gloeotrichia echinulata CP02]|jgi:type I restriction enzyme S subunit|nr:restriction endonuclease subunit S [Gloeotrichia echinulata DEX184]
MVESLFSCLPLHWKVTTLGESCKKGGGNIQTGPFGSQLHASDYVPFGIPSIMPQNIGDNRVLTEGIARITSEDAARLSRYLVKKGDIVYSRRGDVERRALIRTEEDGWLCGTGCLRVRFGNSEVDPLYASYYLGHPSVRGWIVRHAVGATMPNLNTSILSALPFVIPPLPEQKAIAHILGTLDNKIELNREMNQTLENIAWTIFNSWFQENNFPENWQILPLEECMAEIIDYRGKTPKKTTSGIPLITAKIVKNGRINQPEEYIALEDYHSWMRRGFPESGDVVMTTEAPLGEIAQLDGRKVALAQRLITLRGKPGILDNTYLKFLMQSSFVQDQLHARATGTTVFGIRQSELREVLLAIPPFPEQKAIASVLRNLEDKIGANEKESLMLAAIRDSLLPQILSGQIQVRDREIFVENSI